MNTLLLDPADWDLLADGSNNIAMASNPYSIAQDSASQIMTYSGEVYYNTTLGLPYFNEVLGYNPPPSLMKTLFVQAALLTPETVQARVFLTEVNRVVGGQVQILDDSGNVISFAGF